MKTIFAGAALAAAVALPAQAQMADHAMHGEAAPPATEGDSPAPVPAPASASTKPMPMMAMNRPSAAGSGTSRLPAADEMVGLHIMTGGWMVMAHGYAWGAATSQGGPRGDDMAFVQSMAMVQASRTLSPGVDLQLRSMASLDPLMGNRGYPNLFANGESANGQALVDRQHPHDLFMELSARIDVAAGPGSLFLYGGLPGEPALGPSAFMHRGSARLIPEAPITHHWLDSTHITFGVVTAGYGTRLWQLEGSVFNGREPDERRWNIETAPLDSWSVRASLTPGPHWAAQVSYGRLKEPEALHPGEDEARLTASLSYARPGFDATVAFARKDRLPGRALTAWLAEATWSITQRHAVFSRVENVANDELFEADHLSPLHDLPFRVTRFTGGYAYTIPMGLFSLSLGASGSVYAKPAALDAAYGKAPKSLTLFAKLALGK
jgi:hypothetical protein